MAIGHVNPEGDGTVALTPSGSGNHWSNILVDAAYRQPSSHFSGQYDPANYESGGSSPAYVTDEYLMGTISGVSAVSSVKIWIWVSGAGGGESFEVSVFLGGSYQTPQSDFGAGAWKSFEFTGSWTQSDLDALKVKVGLQSDYGSFLVAMYAEITYTEAGGPPTGGTITRDGDYLVHKFTSSGTFNTNGATLDCRVFVQAGGGGGAGGAKGGGGGAGGQLEKASHSVTGSVAVTVGAGGDGGVAAYDSGDTGEDSAFGALIADGGGGGGQSELGGATGFPGGSAGGAGGDLGGTGASATQGTVDGATGYGEDGGDSDGTAGGGGGGAGAPGGDGASSTPGAGGTGRACDITGSSVTYGAGGPGVATTAIGSAGAANTGDGGAAGGTGVDGFDGGSGVVIVRYYSPLGAVARRGFGPRIGSRQPLF